MTDQTPQSGENKKSWRGFEFKGYESIFDLDLNDYRDAQNLSFDIGVIISKAFHKFIREHPGWFDTKDDWGDNGSEYRFQLPTNMAVKEIIKLLEKIQK